MIKSRNILAAVLTGLMLTTAAMAQTAPAATTPATAGNASSGQSTPGTAPQAAAPSAGTAAPSGSADNAAQGAAAATPAEVNLGDLPVPQQSWSFAGIFGRYDQNQLRRGFQVFKEVCSSCHSANLLSFRNLSEPGGPEYSAAQVKALAAQVLSLIADARFAPVFADGSRAEVAIAGRLTTRRGDPVPVSGQIDRLVVTPEAVLIVDYKTGHAPPASAAQAPPAYVRQLALYRAVLTRLYPRLPVRAALLWTETPELMEISAAMLEAELEALISA